MRILLARRAAERAAVRTHQDLSRGLYGLATVAATAPFIGVLGVLLGINNSFPGVGTEKSTVLGIIAGRLSDAMAPAALGLAVAITALWGYCYCTAVIADFDTEMAAAILSLPTSLAAAIRREE